MNTASLAGILDRVEWKTTRAGKDFATFTVQVTEVFAGEQKTHFIPVTAFGKSSQSLEHIQPGAIISVACRVQSREYNGKHYLDLTADSVTLLHDEPVSRLEQRPMDERIAEQAAVSFEDDDIPF